MRKFRSLLCLATLFSLSTFYLAGWTRSVSADSAPQTLPFTQNWANTGLITTNDNWSGVAGIEGYLGQDITTATGVDPQTLLTTSSLPSDLDVIANQANPNTLTAGGVAEFEITDPVVALQGSGTADAPYVLIYLNATGQSNINVAYSLRDIDGSTDNAIQPVALQYRVGSSGNFTNIPAGFVADATSGPSQATLVTPVSAALPSDANNQPLVQVRIITSNAAGSDEWVGIDNINVTAGPATVRQKAPVDFNGDGKTDFSVVRYDASIPNSQVTWYNQYNGTGGSDAVEFGLSEDAFLPADYDGDGKADVAVYRPSSNYWYILQSSTSTVRSEEFGLPDDDPTVIGDYDGDGKVDIAVYRAGDLGAQSTWFYRTVVNGPTYYVPWGIGGDIPAPGDYDGDGKNDVSVQRDGGGGAAVFITALSSNSSVTYDYFGLSSDFLAPGDYDGDGKTDYSILRASMSGQIQWFYKPSSQPSTNYVQIEFGTLFAPDYPVPGDYDGDGKTDQAVWRPDSDPNANYFYVNQSTGGLRVVEWGQSGDFPVATYNLH